MKTAFNARNRSSNVSHTWHLFWVAALTALLALAMALVAAAQSADDSLSDSWSQAVDAYRVGNVKAAHLLLNREVEQQDEVATGPAVMDQGLLAWKTLVAQSRKQYDVAENIWARVELGTDQTHWKQVALASIYLERGWIEHAGEQLAAARRQAPDNPVVRYYTGLLHVERAAAAGEWYDAGEPGRVRLAVYQPDVVPNSRSMYLLAACQELELALTLPAANADEPLVDRLATVEPALRPCVGDLLHALSATDYAAQSHQVLAQVYLRRDMPLHAEQHLNAAADAGLPVIGAYSELGESFEQSHDFTSAGRAYTKAIEYGDAPVTNLRNAWRSFQRAAQ